MFRLWEMITSRRLTVWLVVLIILVASSMFLLKYTVVTLDDQIKDVRSQIAKYEEDMHVMRAEFKVRTSAERLRELVEKHTEYTPITAKRMRNFEHEAIFQRDNINKFIDTLE